MQGGIGKVRAIKCTITTLAESAYIIHFHNIDCSAIISHAVIAGMLQGKIRKCPVTSRYINQILHDIASGNANECTEQHYANPRQLKIHEDALI